MCCLELRGFVSTLVLLKMPGGGKCVFNSDWVLNGAYKDWLQVVKGDKHAAYCKLCIVKSVPIARSFASVEETSQVAPKTFTNDIDFRLCCC